MAVLVTEQELVRLGFDSDYLSGGPSESLSSEAWVATRTIHRVVLELHGPGGKFGVKVEGWLKIGATSLPNLSGFVPQIATAVRMLRDCPELVAMADQPKLDGLEPPNLLWWKRDRHELPPRLWALANYMWDKDKAPVQELCKRVWEDEGLEVADSTIRSTLSQLNSRLATIGIPWTLSYSKGQILKNR